MMNDLVSECISSVLTARLNVMTIPRLLAQKNGYFTRILVMLDLTSALCLVRDHIKFRQWSPISCYEWMMNNLVTGWISSVLIARKTSLILAQKNGCFTRILVLLDLTSPLYLVRFHIKLTLRIITFNNICRNGNVRLTAWSKRPNIHLTPSHLHLTVLQTIQSPRPSSYLTFKLKSITSDYFCSVKNLTFFVKKSFVFVTDHAVTK